MNAHLTDWAHWWRDRGVLQRFVTDLIRGELGRLRPGRAALPLAWPEGAHFEDDLGIDSLERLQLVTALGQAIHLHRSGAEDTLLARRTLAEWVTAAETGLDTFSAELTFQTSGSTGHPKWCTHELVELQAEVIRLADLVTGAERVLCAVPSHHIYGFLFAILLPARLRAVVIDVRAQRPSGFAHVLQRGDVVIGYPEFWRAFARAVPAVASGVTGITSTAPCPADIAVAVRHNGIARFVDVYGSSETAGIGWRDDPHAAYELFPYWRRGAGDAELVRTKTDGAERIMKLPDRLVWDDARHVRPAGRIEGAVQVGGMNVFPDRVATVLCANPAVAQAVVRLMRPDEGGRLKAFVVPRDPDADIDLLATELRTYIDTSLTVPERPKSLVFGPQLPINALGKSVDWSLAAASASDDMARG